MSELVNSASGYVMLFAAFSIIGWAMEVVLKYIQYHRFINRGYLIGPYCPIYGWGVLLITLLGGGVFYRRCTPIEAFLVGFVACGSLEYFVSWFMEKTSHARWWDYSGKPLNINGRVWIGNLTLFGLAAVFIVYIIDPVAKSLFERIPDITRAIIAGAFLVIFWTDRVVSNVLMRVIRDCIDKQDADNTEEIRVEMHKMLNDRSLLARRLAQAYPDILPMPAKLSERLKAARTDYRDATKRLKKQLRELSRLNADKRRAVEDGIRARVNQAKEAQYQAREKLRKLERDALGRM